MNKALDYVEVSFGPIWSYVASVRSFAGAFCSIGLADQRVASRVTLVVSELLENCVKYSTDRDIWIRLEIDRAIGRIAVRTRNRASPEDIAILEREVGLLEGRDPLEAYVEKLRKAGSEPAGTRNMLGLARIVFEAGAGVQASHEGAVVEVIVSCTFDLEAVGRTNPDERRR